MRRLTTTYSCPSCTHSFNLKHIDTRNDVEHLQIHVFSLSFLLPYSTHLLSIGTLQAELCGDSSLQSVHFHYRTSLDFDTWKWKKPSVVEYAFADTCAESQRAAAERKSWNWRKTQLESRICSNANRLTRSEERCGGKDEERRLHGRYYL